MKIRITDLPGHARRNLLTSSCCAGMMAALVSSASAAVFFDGHGDIGIGNEEGPLELHYHFEDGLNETGPEVEFAPNEVIVQVADEAIVTTTVDFTWLGTSTGDDVWLIPEVLEVPDVPFLGIGVELDDTLYSSVDLTLTGFDGPGEFALWQAGLTPATPNVFMQTLGGVTGADTVNIANIPVGPPGEEEVHEHFVWGFTEAGTYEITFTAVANQTALGGGGTETDTATFTFAVGTGTPIPEPSAALGGLGASLLLLLRRRRR